MEDLSVNMRIVLIWSLKKWDGISIDWIHVAQDGDKWWLVVIVLITLWIP